MHFIYLTNGLPYPGNNGIPMLGWALVNYMVKVGHKVTVIGLQDERDDFTKPEHQYMLNSIGIETIIVPYKTIGNSQNKIKNYFNRLKFEKIYPTAYLTSSLEDIINQKNPDAIIAVHIEALAPLLKLHKWLCMGIMGDLTHSRLYYQWRYIRSKSVVNFWKRFIVILPLLKITARYELAMLKNCNLTGAVSASEASWLRNHGLYNCKYYRIPIANDVEIKRIKKDKNDKYKLVLLGALHGTATRTGLSFFVNRVCPFLEKVLEATCYEIHIIGSGKWPEEVPDISAKKNIKLRGYVDDLSQELLSTDVFLAPTPMPLGIRVRVLTALSYGCCIVSHRANSSGIPELKDGINCLLADSGEEFANKIIIALKDRKLRDELSSNARKTFEKFFTATVAAKEIVGDLEKLAAK